MVNPTIADHMRGVHPYPTLAPCTLVISGVSYPDKIQMKIKTLTLSNVQCVCLCWPGPKPYTCK